MTPFAGGVLVGFIVGGSLMTLLMLRAARRDSKSWGDQWRTEVATAGCARCAAQERSLRILRALRNANIVGVSYQGVATFDVLLAVRTAVWHANQIPEPPEKASA